MRSSSEDMLLDRLVDGELTEQERRDLLRRLETTPDGWRRCALAFLEAQSWSAAMHPLAATQPAPALTVVAATPSPAQTRRWSLLAKGTALAASFALVFVLGWAWPHSPVDLTQTARDNPIETPTHKIPAPLVARPAPPAEPAPDSSLIDRVVQQWQQHGYQTERQTRRVAVELNDGSQIEVPIEELRVQYVGNRTY